MTSDTKWSNGNAPTEVPPREMSGLTYRPPLTEVNYSARRVLEKWSEIPPEKVVQHVNDVVRSPLCIYSFINLDAPSISVNLRLKLSSLQRA